MNIKNFAALTSICCLLAACDSDIEKELTKQQKITVCKHYISAIVGRSASSMKNGLLKEDGGFFTEIHYTRSSDQTVWSNMCHIDNNIMVWANISNGQLGRWRFEDEVKLSIINQGKTVKAGSLFSLDL